MSDPAAIRTPHHEHETIPRVLVRGMFALVLAVLLIVTWARLTDRPVSSTPPVSAIVAEKALILAADDLSGAIRVFDANGTLLADLDAEAGGFIAGVHRVVLRERVKGRVTGNGPVLLQRSQNGRLSLTDPSTGWHADLMGFGADNARAFAKLLE